jgi:predicted AAA+ superfamily ATPase
MLSRCIRGKIEAGLARGKSILLFGPRQTGKTTLIKSIDHDRYTNLMNSALRRHYEQKPESLIEEIKALAESLSKKPLVIIDEVQRCPEIMNIIQLLIDDNLAQFIITGSSARKLRRYSHLNLLPGRIISLNLAPLIQSELPNNVSLIDQLNYGSLPGIILQENPLDKAQDLSSYTDVYLEEEVRAEALVRDLANFSRFLHLSAAESGEITNFSRLGEAVGISHVTIKEYYQILEDCLIAIRLEPFIENSVRKRLIKSPRYIYFDLGVRRSCANESAPIPEKQYGPLFEQWVILETWRWQHYFAPRLRLFFWRDSNGPEVDLVIQAENDLLPIEIKWTENPDEKDIRHLRLFMQEYPQAKKALVICRVPYARKLHEHITAIPWQAWQQYLEKKYLNQSN